MRRCCSYRVLLFLLPLLFCLSDQLLLNLMGDLHILQLAGVHREEQLVTDNSQ